MRFDNVASRRVMKIFQSIREKRVRRMFVCVCVDAVCNVPFCLLSSVVSGTSQNVRVRIMTGCGNHTNFLKPFEMCMHTYDACQP